MLLLVILCLIHPNRGDNFDYPIGGPERADPINPQLFFTCLAPIFDSEYGRFDPVIYRSYPLTLPPIAGCPEVVNKKTIRFFAISKKDPTVITSVKNIKPGSKVAIYIHGYVEEYDEIGGIAIATTLLRKNDWVVLVDWARLADSRVFGTVRIPLVNVFLSTINPILVGRVVCKFIKFLNTDHGIEIDDIFLVGFSSGSVAFGFLADYCREKYRVQFKHMMAIELVARPFRGSNYPLANSTSAKYFEVIFSTISPNNPALNQLSSTLAHLGYFEVIADCAYYVNPKSLLTEQPPCLILPGPTFCSHFFGIQVFLSAYSGRCLYGYGPCPDFIGVPSNQETGLTRLNCEDHPFLHRTCIQTSANPVKSC
ncbi:uncharacterized protein LOC141857294 [Brevipalpus obovatus]|uniref:uncharacterized protein LOC141857294 n=1 Tax=Brevipalpus obovatus TaxID=246614 RepID=UPI003D9E28F0